MSNCTKKIFIIAGEVSGDFLGAKIIEHLRGLAQEGSVNLDIRGIGGDFLQKQGVNSIFPMQDIAMMGFVELIPHIFKILKRINSTARSIQDFNPDIVITIDAQGFCKKLVKTVKPLVSSRFIHIVAPQVWAWKKARAKTLHKIYDDLLCLFPFEPKLFTPYNLRAVSIGHPIIEKAQTTLSISAIKEKYSITSEHKVFSALPGSRLQELNMHLDILEKTLLLLSRQFQFTIFIPIVLHLKEFVKNKTKNWPGRVILVETDIEKSEAYTVSDAALVCSGTATLEVALHKTPMLVFYKSSWLTGVIARLIIDLKYISLANLVCFFGGWLKNNPAPIKEFVLNDCNAEKIYAGVIELLDTSSDRHLQQSSAYEYIEKYLQPDGRVLPSQAAAKYIFQALELKS